MADPLTELLAESDVVDKSGATLKLGSFFEDKPAALHFIRHFG